MTNSCLLFTLKIRPTNYTNNRELNQSMQSLKNKIFITKTNIFSKQKKKKRK